MQRDVKKDHKKLSAFVKRLESDLRDEAADLTRGTSKTQAPQLPQPTEFATLKLKDGRQIKIPILEGSEPGKKFLDIQALYAQANLFMFDPGYKITGSCHSAISNSTEDGQIYYRGYAIRDLVAHSNFVETQFLLLYGQLPSEAELLAYKGVIGDEMLIHQSILDFYKGFAQSAHPMSIMCSIVGAFSSFVHTNLDVKDPKQRELSALKLIAKIPTLAAIAFRTSSGLPIVLPERKMGYTENFLHMMFSDPMDKDFKVPQIFVETMDKILLLHADLDQGPSTTAVRIAGSSMANPYAAVAAGFASLWGENHGGANEQVMEMLEEIGSPSNVANFLVSVKHKQALLMGFGHRVFKAYDPRAQVCKEMIIDLQHRLGIRDQLFDIALEIEH